ncbi:MAG: hypothetical protein ABIY70_11920 [Capsulimonas sp.]|uniref:hypothetical protein n=1 Tax=Capsulimonas sp. TaxID=2494211 RepID=UPI00326435E6
MKRLPKSLLLSCIAAITAAPTVVARQSAAKPTPLPIHPIISPDGELLGATRNGKWILQDKAARLLTGGETYHAYSISSRLGTVRGGKPVSMDAPCPDQMTVSTQLPAGAVIGVGGAWNALPRRQRSENTTQPIYKAAVRNVLIANGIHSPVIHIDQIIRCDLDGDKTDEVLISAHRYTDNDRGFQPMPAGGYSLILMRKLVRGKIKTSIVTAEFYPKPKPESAPLTYHIDGLYDLMGNGKMQIVIGWRYYEGSGMDVYTLSGAEAHQVLSSGCGA